MVSARETSLQELLEGSKQYQVPLYQRTYSWTKSQLSQLWEDIVKLARDRIDAPDATHFIGSVVLAPSPANGPAGVSEFLIVDGQQRLTTLSILLCAIRDHRAATEDVEHRERIGQQYLINKWKPESQRLKVLPTQADRPAYLACIDSTPQAGGGDPVGAAYRFFKERLVAADDPDDTADIERIEGAVISGLSLVSVVAQHGDNVHRIFESLNNTGLDLSQADLLRNYVFMRLPVRGQAVYDGVWLPMQQALPGKNLELLFWFDLVHRDARINQTDTYAAQQRRLAKLKTEAAVEEEVHRFARLAQLLRVVLKPELEPNAELRRRLERVGKWGSTTTHPLVLHLLHRRANATATDEQVVRALAYLESFLVRRLLVGRATANLNRIMLSSVTEMPQDLAVDDAVAKYLSTGRKYFATDDEIERAMASIPFYLNGRPSQRSLVLRWLEESYGSKEPVDNTNLTIEHVLPQTLTSAWRAEIESDLKEGEDAGQVYESLVHTLGNLTLTGYNPELSNKPFAAKRTHLASSGLSMNQEIAQQDRWSRPEIQARASRLARRASELWPGPVHVATAEPDSVLWERMNAALSELPAGSWTTYGDLAALIGSHPVPVGQRLANAPAPNAHRVLQADGSVSPRFRWLDGRADDVHRVLRAEGIVFDERSRADSAQRMRLEDLAQLVGLEVDELLEPVVDPHPGQDSSLRDTFVEQVSDLHGATVMTATIQFINSWTDVGGTVRYGTGRHETTCFLVAREPSGNVPGAWPMIIYPSGTVEVGFKRLRNQAPFDDVARREELRIRLNQVPGVSMAAAKVELRPGFRIKVLTDASARNLLIEHLGWLRGLLPTADAIL